MLAESDAALPPIVVHRSTMRVIDGMHRLRAARLRGQDEIDVRFYDGDEDNAFVIAVAANITHGLPLSLADRTAAAARIVGSHPQWSDRKIAAVTGLADTTVSAIRRRSSAVVPQSNTATRIGRDGRARPLSAVGGRALACELITGRPGASIREIAREAGIAPSTVLDVRKRLRAGQDPVPRKQRDGNRGPRPPGTRARSPGEAAGESARPPSIVDAASVLRNLQADPSLRLTDAGRTLLRWLHGHLIDTQEWAPVVGSVPAHCAGRIAELARATGNAWHDLAAQLEELAP